MNELLKGTWDMHVHTSPDVKPRKQTDLEMVQNWKDNGMAGGVIKCHYMDTTGRAALLQSLNPEMKIYGGLVLNRQAGGLNPDAVLRMAEAGGKYLWFPTMDSAAYCRRHFKNQPDVDLSGMVSVLDENGNLYPQVYDILDIAARFDLVVGTGHVGEAEGMPLVREAYRRGVRKMILTHAENPNTPFSIEAQKECVRMGARVEHSFFTLQFNRVTWETMAEQIRAVGVENVIPVTDFGQTNAPDSPEGILMFMQGLMERGFTEPEIDMLFRKNPYRLFEE